MMYKLLPLMILVPLIALTLTHKTFLLCLLNLEAMTLGLLTLTSTMLSFHSKTETLPPLLILSLGACEASLGLACLVKMMRTYGSDNLKSLNITKC